jgi:hypothetical protein
VSEKVTHTAVVDDCFRLVLSSGELCEAFSPIMREHWDFARLGGGTRAGDRHSVQLLASFRERWASRTASDRLEPKLAFVLGWLCHRAADRQMKPIFRQTDPGSEQKPTDCSVYHEAYLFSEAYAGDPERLYTLATFEGDLSSLPAAAVLDVAAVRELFHTLMQQALVEIHTFSPDEAHIESWLDGLFGLQQRFYVDVERYAQAIAEPDPDEVRASMRANAASHYAQALAMGCRYLLAASAFFEEKISAEELRERLDVGKPGRDGRSV